MRGIIPPPKIIIIKKEEPCEVYFPSPFILRVNIQGYIIEQEENKIKLNGYVNLDPAPAQFIVVTGDFN